MTADVWLLPFGTSYPPFGTCPPNRIKLTSQDLYVRLADDPSPIVAATALVGLVSYGSGDPSQHARDAIDSFAEFGSHSQRLALARAIRYSPGAVYGDVLLRLADTSEVDICIAVARAMREILNARFIPALLPMLPIRALRKEARATLVAIGVEALTQLDAVLGDPQADPDVRLHVPRTISFFPPRQAATVLMDTSRRQMAARSSTVSCGRLVVAARPIRRSLSTTPC